MDKRTFKITGDGSHTLYVEALDETYHSRHGAIQEAIHVFIQAGINYLNKKEINVLEVGFGTGLNAFLSLLESTKKAVSINYTSIEAYPLDEAITAELNYTAALAVTAEEKELFSLLHQVAWQQTHELTPLFSLTKLNVDLLKYEGVNAFDVIYFDAFGPNVQPEMWTKAIFEKMYDALHPKGILVTYCAKGSVKRTLKEVGFKIEALPGPPGKREMTRALKPG